MAEAGGGEWAQGGGGASEYLVVASGHFTPLLLLLKGLRGVFSCLSGSFPRSTSYQLLHLLGLDSHLPCHFQSLRGHLGGHLPLLHPKSLINGVPELCGHHGDL